MARLNEPPALAPALSTTAAQPGAESVDAADFDEVKRRFTRQNRDLAKNNSTQSLRIRSLEIEVGKLQAENLAFQERVLQLQNELDEARSGQLSGEAVRRVREELQAKLAELSGLVEGIDALANAAGDGVVETVRERKPLEGQWRERQPLTEAMRENQMPTIAEDKHYPRTTLGVDEIQSLRLSDQGSNESPDLGPPPVAHFDYEDPVKQLSLSAIGPSTETPEEDEGLPASLSINLETRRRRKDSQPKLEIRRHSIIAQSPKETDSEPLTILRTGAKRKLADRELDKAIPPLAKSDFTFSRKSTASDSKALMAPSMMEKASAPAELVAEITPTPSATPPRPSRRVLGDKSVNTSPRKVLASTAPEKASKDAPEPLTKPAGPRSASAAARQRRTSAIPQPLQHEEVLPTVELAPPDDELHQQVLAPETHAEFDLFSPTPSETPATRPADESIRAGTPPPSDLSTLSIATDGGVGGGLRPSRRARVPVNYAEPSLTTKIRRPGNGMVDAVNGLVDPRRAMSAPTSKPTIPHGANVKREHFENDEAGELGLDWRSLPSAMENVVVAGSPLAPKSVEIGSSDPLTSQADAPVYRPEHPSAASATISTLMAAGRRHRRESTQHLQHPSGGLDSDVAAKLHELDLYDFKDSSSPPSSSAEKFTALSTKTLGDNAKSSKVPAGSHRRHSSVPKILRETSGGMQALEGRTGDGPVHSASAKGTAGMVGGPAGSDGRAERAASRRRSMIS
ncbi:hypothetical protein LTR91_002104 [Friedmanniomyces endolithicus]|uniref:Shugoshin C-terminal domain-containing protein n=1 Tax=Friedmanniomyces endolithicus TaxID=329885 RepID=A0AAN6L2H0_9PEZI|nr:hypothetical protein LTS00_003083 [Friedmanniomyces endolithicus]KAK1011633.1 hypothetical protein LTR91_002104 [Friedmanniomyces endolithicus]KAK1015731.1 hypothetical protein LTR54_003459 [Friedmanniomyces endolithicus]